MSRVENFDYCFPSTVSAVLFDGRKVALDRIRVADEKTGELTIYVQDKLGNFLFDPVRMDTKIHTFKGKVEIEWKK